MKNLSTIKCINFKNNNRFLIGAICANLNIPDANEILYFKGKYQKVYIIEDVDDEGIYTYKVFAGFNKDEFFNKYIDVVSNEYLLSIEDSNFSHLKIPNINKSKFINLKTANYENLSTTSLKDLKRQNYDKVFLASDGEVIIFQKNQKNIISSEFTFLTDKEINMIINNSKEIITTPKKKFKEKTDYIQNINNKLEDAIKNENYEAASILNDKLSNLDTKTIKALERELEYCIKTHNFEKAIIIRNQIKELYKNSKSIEFPKVEETKKVKEVVKEVKRDEIKPDLSKLEKKLEEYLRAEQYEMAAELRDKINKIKNPS